MHKFSRGFPRFADRLGRDHAGGYSRLRDLIRNQVSGRGLRTLEIFDEAVPRIPTRPLSEVEGELKEIGGSAGLSELLSRGV